MKILPVKFAVILKQLMDRKSVKKPVLSRAIGVPVKTIADWLEGSVPRDLDAVRRTALYFGVSLHYLLYGEEDIRSTVEDYSERTELHLGWYKISVWKVIPKK